MADRQLFDRPDADHRFHDLLLVAALAAGDLDAGNQPRARALVEGCRDCAALAADLRAISAATASLPAAERPRDFRLTETDAQRLRPHGFQRVRAAFDGRRLQLARPLATGLTMLGLVGVIVTSLPTMSVGGQAGGAPSTDDRISSEHLQAPPAASDRDVVAQGEPSGAPAAGNESARPVDASGDAFEDASPLTLASGDGAPDPEATTGAVAGRPSPAPVDAPAPTSVGDGVTADQLAAIRWISMITLVVGLVLLGGSTILVRARRRR